MVYRNLSSFISSLALICLVFSCNVKVENKDNISQVRNNIAVSELHKNTQDYFEGCLELLKGAKSGDTISWHTYYTNYFPMLRAYYENLNISEKSVSTKSFNGKTLAFTTIPIQTHAYFYRRDPKSLDTLISEFQKCVVAMEQIQLQFRNK